MKIISFIKNFKTVNYKTTIKGQAQSFYFLTTEKCFDTIRKYYYGLIGKTAVIKEIDVS